MHTPGPWTVTEPPDVLGIVGPKGIPIADVDDSYFDDSTEVPEANARLIAAAPALLAALKALVADWESVSPDDQVPDEINATVHWGDAYAAIALAEKGA